MKEKNKSQKLDISSLKETIEKQSKTIQDVMTKNSQFDKTIDTQKKEIADLKK